MMKRAADELTDPTHDYGSKGLNDVAKKIGPRRFNASHSTVPEETSAELEYQNFEEITAENNCYEWNDPDIEMTIDTRRCSESRETEVTDSDNDNETSIAAKGSSCASENPSRFQTSPASRATSK